MSLLEQHRNNVQRSLEKIAGLTKEKAREQKKIADLSKKISHASDAIGKTKSTSTIQSRRKEIERCQKAIALAEKKLATIETKIMTQQKALGVEQKKVSNEEEKEVKRHAQVAKKLTKENQKQLEEMHKTLQKHDQLHEETLSAIEKLQQLPEKITVLFFASNPLDWEQLRLDEEVRTITDMIRKAKHRDVIKLESCWAVQPLDVFQALNEHTPAIVHFSGHGSEQDEIIFHDKQGMAKKVSKSALVQTMMASSEGIRLVFFNTCYSRNQAEAVVEFVEVAIGMNTKIGDEAARVFAAQFYSSIGFGHSVKKAFEQAKGLLMMEGIPEENTPELFVHEGLDPEALIIVRPNLEER